MRYKYKTLIKMSRKYPQKQWFAIKSKLQKEGKWNPGSKGAKKRRLEAPSEADQAGAGTSGVQSLSNPGKSAFNRT